MFGHMIFHKYKLIFICVAKNASASIFESLQNQTDREFAHKTIFEVFAENDPELASTYYAFATSRNPYDRFYSAYMWLNINNRDRNENPIDPDDIQSDFERYVDQVYKNRDSYFNDPHHLPQYRYVSFREKLLIDEVLTFENLEADWNSFAEKYNLTSQFKLKHKLQPCNISMSRKKDWHDAYTTEMKKKIYDVYWKDFELFSYESEL